MIYKVRHYYSSLVTRFYITLIIQLAMKWQMMKTSKLFIVYCTIAGFISAWAISGLLVVIDLISGTPADTFFGVLGISLGFTDSTTARYVGFALHVLIGMAAGNIFGQIALFWHKKMMYLILMDGLFLSSWQIYEHKCWYIKIYNALE